MILIGEKINGSIPAVAEAIAVRDAQFIQNLAEAQAKAGADYIDCCAAVPEEEEAEVLKWMIACIEEATELPVSVDSASADVLRQVYSCCRRPGLFNSVSGAGDKADKIFSIMALEENQDWEVIALLSDDRGIPATAAERLQVFEWIMKKAEGYGIDPCRIYVDPLVEMLCMSEDGIATVVDVISGIRKRCPKIHITGAVSNISFHLPARRLVNYGFLVLTMSAGLDSAILDPTNQDMMGMVYATEALLGRDECCGAYIQAYRDGIFE